MNTAPLLQQTEEFLHRQIPLTRAMGVSVESFEAGRLVLTAPLELNHNHLGTAFGGSLSAIATLAGYSLLWLELGDARCHLVIRDSEMRFKRPVRGMIRAIGHRPEAALLAAFQARFAEKGRARIRLAVTIEEEGEVAVEFEGTFVALSEV